MLVDHQRSRHAQHGPDRGVAARRRRRRASWCAAAASTTWRRRRRPSRTSAARGREQDRLSAVSGAHAGEARRSRVARVTRSARAPGASRPASAQPRHACPATGGGGEQLAGGEVAALVGGQPLVELQRPRLLEQVDDGVAVAAEASAGTPAARRRAAGPMPSARSRSVVGHRQTRGRACAEQRDVGVGQVGGVDRAWSSGPSTPVRRRAAASACSRARARQASFSAGCSERWTCSGAPRAAAQSRDRRAAVAAGTARTEWMAAPIAGVLGRGAARRRAAPRRARRRRRSARCTPSAAGPKSPPCR